MQRAGAALLLLLFASPLGAFIIPVAAVTSPKLSGVASPSVTHVSTVATTTNQQAVFFSFERKVYFAQGLWWVFYSNGDEFVYQTSPDGVVWNMPTVIVSRGFAQSGLTFSTWSTGDTFYYVTVPSDVSTPGDFFLYRYGTFSHDGSIAWEVPETSVPTRYATAFSVSITVDGGGNIWTAIATIDPTVYPPYPANHLEVYRRSNVTGTWSMVKFLTDVNGFEQVLLPLSSGVALMYDDQKSAINITTSGDGG
jgi:hypothetical protein